MKTKTITLYTIDELQEASPKGYDKAIEHFRSNNDYFFLEDCLNERLKEELEAKGLIYEKYPVKEGLPCVHYSLGYSQGDGVCFEGVITFPATVSGRKSDYIITIKHSGRYAHSNSKDFYTTDTEGEEVENWQEIEEQFNVMYKDICTELEAFGYNFIEGEDSEEYIKDNCDANEYHFTIGGVLTND
jgi:hypothetical protein